MGRGFEPHPRSHFPFHHGPVAQWLEQGTHNPLVVGSIPTWPTRQSCLVVVLVLVVVPRPVVVVLVILVVVIVVMATGRRRRCEIAA